MVFNYTTLTCVHSQQLCPGSLNLLLCPSLTHQLRSPGEFELLTSDHFDKQEIVEFSAEKKGGDADWRGRVEREGGEGGWRGRVEREGGGKVEEGGEGEWRGRGGEREGEGGWRECECRMRESMESECNERERESEERG